VAGGPAVAPGGRSTGPRGVLCAVGIVVAGQPGAMAWRRLIAAVMSSVQGQRAESRSLSRRPPRTIRPATENSRGRRRLGFRRRAVRRGREQRAAPQSLERRHPTDNSSRNATAQPAGASQTKRPAYHPGPNDAQVQCPAPLVAHRRPISPQPRRHLKQPHTEPADLRAAGLPRQASNQQRRVGSGLAAEQLRNRLTGCEEHGAFVIVRRRADRCGAAASELPARRRSGQPDALDVRRPALLSKRFARCRARTRSQRRRTGPEAAER
jgi:hypothetical protein